MGHEQGQGSPRGGRGEARLVGPHGHDIDHGSKKFKEFIIMVTGLENR